MRIMIASSSYAPAMNGQAVFTTNLAESLANLGHQVTVVIDSRQVHASSQVVNGVRLEEPRSVSLNSIRTGAYFSPFPGREIKRLIAEFQPEIVHIQDHYPTCKVVMKIARQNGIKLVGSNHFIPENLAPYVPGWSSFKPVFSWLLWQWMLSVYRKMDAITAQSKAAAILLQHWNLNMPIVPISCGIDLHIYSPNPGIDRSRYRQRYGIDAHKKVFFFLGRIDGEKRVDLLLKAMHRLPRNDIQLVVSGHGSVEKHLRRMAKDMGLTERVRFTGFIPDSDVAGMMNSVDVFIMPSEAELLSISTLEAMACGRPVLLANALALPELVRDGENGYLFKPGDVDDLCQRMAQLADHPDRWPAMGAASRQISLAHSLDETTRKFQNLYGKLIGVVPITETQQQVKEPI